MRPLLEIDSVSTQHEGLNKDVRTPLIFSLTDLFRKENILLSFRKGNISLLFGVSRFATRASSE